MKILWVGDANVSSGFARVTHAICDRLQDTHGHDVSCLGINASGDPQPATRFPVYPAHLGGDYLGIRRYRRLVDELRPDVTVILQDVWVHREYLQQKKPGDRVVLYVPVDAENQPASPDLNDADLTIFYTNYGLQVCRANGFMGDAAIIPHGIDLAIFQPQDTVQARLSLGMSQHDAEHAIVVGAVNRNQPRKRLDLTVEAFSLALAQWPSDGPPLYLMLHTQPRDRIGYDLYQLREYYGLQGHILFPTIGDDGPWTGRVAWELDDAQLATLYASMDLQVSTSVGEGFGLTTAEGMACGVPQILPEHSALAEWPRPAAYYVPAPHRVTTPGLVNTVGRVVEASALADAILALAQAPTVREHLRQAGLALMGESRFDWNVISTQFDRLLTGVIEGEVPEDLLVHDAEEVGSGLA